MSTRRSHRVLLAVAVVALATSPIAADAVRLRGSVRLAGRANEVRLADVAELEGAEATRLSDVVVGTIDDPTKAIQISIADVRERLEAVGVNWAAVNLSGRSVTVRPRLNDSVSAPVAMSGLSIDEQSGRRAAGEKRVSTPPSRPAPDQVLASTLVDGTSLRATIASIICRQLDVTPETLRLTFDCARPELLDALPEGLRAETELLGSCTGERSAFAVRLWRDGAIVDSLNIGVRPELLVETARVSNAVSKGDRIGDDNIGVQAEWMTPIQAAAALRRTEALGAFAQRSLAPGEPVGLRDVQPRHVVSRGDRVFVRVIVGSHAIKLEAEALADGAVGDRISFRRVGARNRRDRSTFTATVTRSGEAVIESADIAGHAAATTISATDRAAGRDA